MIKANILISLNAVVPLFFYMLAGKISVRMRLCEETFLTELNRLIFKVFMPFVLFHNLYKLRSIRLAGSARCLIFCIISLVVLVAVLMAVIPVFEKDNRKRGVIIQALFRSNCVFYAIPLAQSVFGEEGAALASLLVSVLSPSYNIASVIVLEHYRGGRHYPGRMFMEVLRNPMIIGAIAGAVMACLPFTLPSFIQTPVGQFSSLATPLALFVLGGKFHWDGTGSEWREIMIVVAVKLAVIPSVVLLIMRGLHFLPIEIFTMLCMFATPTATSTYAMAENMGGDTSLAGKLVVTGTVISVATLFVWIFALKTIGII